MSLPPMTPNDTLRADALFEEHNRSLHVRTDRLFMIMLLAQWMAAIIVSVVVAPHTWDGTEQSINQHVWAALFLCGAIVSLPVFLAWRHSGATVTRHCIAIASMLMVGLLVHLSGGRIETHFHYFGTLAFLAFYRDWKVIVTATVVAGLDHLLRGVFWPYSIFGEISVSQWRWLEHVGWVVFEDVVLFVSIAQGTREMRQIADRQARMESVQAGIEREVQQRTEELRLEVAVRRSAEERIRGVAEELSRSNKELESFASIASHDLQEPLRKVQAFGERLRRKLGDTLTPEALADMERIQNAASRMQRLIEDLLVYSRVTTKAKPFETVDLNVVAKEVLSDLEVRIEGTKAVVEVGTLPIVQADALQMRQLLQNLIGNALKYKSPDRAPIVRVAVAADDDDFHTIEVVDNGIGFDEKYKEKIFGVFQRLHDQRQYEGTGIGLAVCKKIVERHGGMISASSPGPDSGAVFCLALPRHRSERELVSP